MKITERDFRNWWNTPVALEFKRLIQEDLDKLAHESMTPEHARDTVEKAMAVGAYEALKLYRDMDYEFFGGITEIEKMFKTG